MKTKLLSAFLFFVCCSENLLGQANITANFSATTVCFNNLTCFTDLSTSPTYSITAWDWDFGDIYPNSSLQNPCHTYPNPGTYTVTLIVTNSNGDNDTAVATVIVYPLPFANFSVPNVCFGDVTCFTDISTISSGTITTWSWNFGDPSSGPNNISSLQNPCHTFTAAGNYIVILTVTSDKGCQSTIQMLATVNINPVASFSNPAGCLGTGIPFTNNSNPSGFTLWSFPGGSPSSSTNSNPTIVYNTAGTYTATLVITTFSGCKDTVTQPVIVYNPPVANFMGADSGCAPVCQTFTDLSTSQDGNISSWLWNFSGGSPSFSNLMNPNICFNSPGTYGASLTVTTNYGCKDTMTINSLVNVYAWPSASFTYTVSGTTITCSDSSSLNVTSWSWSFGDGTSIDTNSSPVHTYSLSNTYTICLGVQNQYGCYDSICQTITIASVNENYLERNIFISPNPTNGMFNVKWLMANGNTSTINHQPSTIEVYNVYGEKVYVQAISDKGTANSNSPNGYSLIPVNLSSQPSGIYFIHISTDKGSVTKKIVVSP